MSSSKTSTAPGWEEALRELVAADTEFIMSKLPEEGDLALGKVQKSLFKLQGILGYVAHSLLVPEDLGRQMMSLTEGWENFWLDYDMLSAVHSPGVLPPGVNILSLSNGHRVDVMDMSLEEISSHASCGLIFARRRLIKSMSNDCARSVYVCARITCVDILLRQPKKSAVFLNSYFQTFPSFICQTASLANLMVNRSLHEECLSEKSIEPMIAFAAMSLLATIVCETNHVTQALSVLSANNPHSGLLANLLSLTLNSNCLSLGSASSNMSKSAIYLLLCSIQNAKHPSSISSPPILRIILETLVNSFSHPDVIHACCICLEVSLEFCPSAFAVLFRDLDALDRLVGCGIGVLKKLPENSQYERSLTSIFSLLRFSFQTQEIHVGINLHEKLTLPDSQLRELFLTVLGSKSFGNGPFNGCMTLVGNVIADDPLIISTMAEVGIVEGIVGSSRLLASTDPKENITACFVAMCALCLHESGSKKLAEFGSPMTDLLRAIAANKFKDSARLPAEEYGMDENRMMDDIGMVIGQSCDDVLRNKIEFKDELIEAVIGGLSKLAKETCLPNIHEQVIPGLRILYTGFLSTSACVTAFLAKGGMAMLNTIIEHPQLEPHSLLKQINGRGHPIVAVFRQIGQRVVRSEWPEKLAISDGTNFSRFATACLLMNSAVQGVHTQMSITGDFVKFVSDFWAGDLASFFSPKQDPLGVAAIKTFLSTTAKIINNSSALSRLVAPGSIVVAQIQAEGLKKLLTQKIEKTELVDILSRCFVEDKNHSVRPVSLLMFYKVGGFELLANLLDDAEPASLEPLLILMERLTSVKRITNSPVTKDFLKTKEFGFNVEQLSSSITYILGSKCFSLHQDFLRMDSLSTTSATAIIKIYSHSVMLADRKDAKPLVVEKSRPTKKPKTESGFAQLGMLTREITLADLPTQFSTPYIEGTWELGKQIAREFLRCCIELGDKGGCEGPVAELVTRHADYLGVDITNCEEPRKSKRIAKKRSL